MITRIAAIASLFLSASAFAQSGAPATMKAVRYHQFGGADQLVYEDAPIPTPGEGEMLIRVHAAGVNPVDAKIRSGMFGKEGTLPAIPGYDVSGIVESAGPGVTKFKKGDEVFAYMSLQRGGGYAQFAIVKEIEAAKKPAGLSHDQAAAVPLASLTAWQALADAAKLEKGQAVLIHGGSGGVGSFAVQIARARGAKVFATASARNQQTLKELGAGVAIDYASQKFEEIAKEMDVVLDTVGGETQARSFAVLKKGGVLVSIVGMPDQKKAEAAGVRATGVLVKPDAAELATIAAMIDEGTIKPQVSMTLPLAEARKAHEQIETGHTRGKIVLRVAEKTP